MSMTGMILTAAVRERLSAPRWVYGGPAAPSYYALCRGCPCCGNMGTGVNAQRGWPCEPATCRLCGSVLCATRSQCLICHYGILPGWSGTDTAQCGYSGCGKQAAAAVRKKLACLAHAWPRVSAQAEAAIAHRDAGEGWEHWRLSGPRVDWPQSRPQ